MNKWAHPRQWPLATQKEQPMAKQDFQETEQIEVTPEMICAGLRELTCYEPGADDGAECIRAVYAAMEEARLRGGGKATRRAG